MCREPFDQPQYKVRITVQRVADNTMSTETYTTTNVANLVNTFGFDPLLDPRFIADILFEIGAHESITHAFHELGLRVPDAPFVPVPTPPDQPHI